MKTIKYQNEQDRCYGLTGMAVSVVVLDREEYLASIDLDADVEHMLEFTPQFFFAGNPRLSARLAWGQLLEQYRLAINILAGNVLSRCYVHRKEELSTELLKELHSILLEEGKEACSLDEDEVDTMFKREFSYMQRVFRHPGVQQIVDNFAAHLKEHRHMSVREVIEQLAPLAHL